jgi:hypothetical protein
MHVTITGATGFIGWRVMEAVRDLLHRPHILVRQPPRDLPPGVAVSIWKSPDVDPPRTALEGADAVIHLAGEPVAQRWTPAVKERIRHSRVAGTQRLVQALAQLERRPKVLVAASAIGYYGDRGSEILTEQSAAGAGFLAEVCRQWEEAADLAEPLGMRVVKIRIGVVLGENGGALKKMLLPFRLGLGGKIGSGDQWMSWVHREDLVQMICDALRDERWTGAVNGVSPHPIRNEDFTAELAAALRRPAVIPVPAAGLKLLYGEMASVLTASQRVIPQAAEKNGFNYHYAELGQALGGILDFPYGTM